MSEVTSKFRAGVLHHQEVSELFRNANQNDFALRAVSLRVWVSFIVSVCFSQYVCLSLYVLYMSF